MDSSFPQIKSPLKADILKIKETIEKLREMD
jgi:hypothetical protein